MMQPFLWLCVVLEMAAGFKHPLVAMPDSVYDYCTLSCPDSSKENVACGRKECELGNHLYEVPWDFTSRRTALDYMNKQRNKLANGPVPSYSVDETGWNATRTYRKATNMRMLSYDTELEFQMVCYLHSGDYLKGTYCCGTKRWPKANTVIKLVDHMRTRSTDEKVQLAVNEWYAYYDWLNVAHFLSYPSYDLPRPTKNFAQFGWAKSTHIGCYAVGISSMNDTGLVGCLMAPAGRVVGQPIYEQGTTMNCPNGTRPNKRFRRLCGEQEPWPPGSIYVGNVILQQRKLYWHPNRRRHIKDGEDDNDMGHVAATAHISTILLMFFLLYYYLNYK